MTTNPDNILGLNEEAFADEISRRHFSDYMIEFSGNQITPFHATFYKILELFADGKIKNLMITVPPQHGKSDGSTRYLPSYILGKDPNKRIAITSYESTFAQKFNRDIQRIMDREQYHRIFPNTCLNGSHGLGFNNKYIRSTKEFEIVGYKGNVKTVGRGGPLTGDPVDIAIMDDMYKNQEEGNSPTIRAKVVEYYIGVITKRLHNDSQQLITFTRWHNEDLVGHLEDVAQVIECTTWEQILSVPKYAWVKINFEALKESDPTELDPRQKGEALWPAKHSVEKHLNDRSLDPLAFDCMNQGHPDTMEGLLYTEFMTYDKLPIEPNIVRQQTDTADEGDCYLCSITYFEYNDFKYVLDVYYTQEPQHITEKEQAKRCHDFNVNKSVIESNNGGKAYARNVKRITRNEYENFKTSFATPTQTQNKESRILTNGSTVCNTVVMPKNWAHRWPEFYKHVTKFRADFSSKYKDGPDVLTAMVEKQKKAPPIIHN